MLEWARRFYDKKIIAVTGGASFIGSHLTERLVSLGAHVIVADDLSSGRLENLAAVLPRISFLRTNLRDPGAAEAALAGASVVFHLAAAHGGRGYIESRPVECLGNMALDHRVFSAAVNANVNKIIFASSACVYPVQLQASAAERFLLKEIDAGFAEPGKAYADGAYGWAKLMSEFQLQAFHRQYGISGVACRLFSAYGERENESHAVIALIEKTLERMDPFPIWGTGEQTRNFTYVQDIVQGLVLAGAKLDGFACVNVGTERHTTIRELLDLIFKLKDWRPCEIAPDLTKPTGVSSRASNNALSRQLLNWEATFPLELGVARTLRWIENSRTKKKFDRQENFL